MATPSDTADKVTLLVDGSRYNGWQSVSINRSLETIAGTFSLTLTERWPGQNTARQIRPGRPCQLLIGDDKVITGYVDDVEPEISKTSHTVQVTGRCKTGDLVDCSAIYRSGQWRNVRLDTIAKNLLEPFGISVIVGADIGGTFASYNIEEGETVFECLERAARQRAVLLVSDAAGNLVITTASETMEGTVLEEGKNIEKAGATLSWKDRYSKYTVKGQGKPTDSDYGEKSTRARGIADDTAIDRYRPLIIINEDAGSTFTERAAWERDNRRGKGSRATITVSSWRTNGRLWTPNMLVPVTSPSLWLDRLPMLIAGCQYQLSDAGSTTVLSLTLPEAFAQIARSKKKKKGRGKGGDGDWGDL